MKKILFLIGAILLLVSMTGCGKVDDSWNGVYKNDSDYSILIYTADQKTASIAVLQVGENFKFFPVQYPNYLNVSEQELTTIMGEPVKVVREGKKIKVMLDSENKGVWEKIEGEYEKVKNAKAFDMNQF